MYKCFTNQATTALAGTGSATANVLSLVVLCLEGELDTNTL